MCDNEIDALKAEIARLRSALQAIAYGEIGMASSAYERSEKDRHIARTALEKP